MAGIELKVNGFSHKLPLLLEQLVRALVGLKVRMAWFPRLIASVEACASSRCMRMHASSCHAQLLHTWKSRF